MYWDDEICNMIVKESNRYARQRNDQTFELTRGELDQFLGIVLLTGYISLPRKRMYWEKSEDFQIPIVGKAMSRSRFEQIKRNLHFANNEDLPHFQTTKQQTKRAEESTGARPVTASWQSSGRTTRW